jgi:hypothetical protein
MHQAQDCLSKLTVPNSLLDLECWAHRRLQGRGLIHQRAIAAATSSPYRNPARVYEILAAMADHYWPMFYAPDCRAEATLRWEESCAALRVYCSHVGMAARTPQTAAKYALLHEGLPRVLTMQIKGSSSFDPRTCLRIYFAPMPDLRSLLVGHLPGHLPNKQSN